ncbi:conserved hypothetical protein [Culex quinquefasciatus]|uniref:Rhomboid-like protein n=1 Tax=Culex quinquefasciatus TaxID=7176 RepID=B0X6D0_CULQU|nr:conserved hypothetical protein [Culex quinquefasciatus]|eukprot:XP_001865202.1 conserved hypothetical protein [Culex quinquefasciatus]
MMESTVKAKPSRVVPTSSSGNNILAGVFGSRQCAAWSENERNGSSSTKHDEDENLAEPFIRKESESSESSGSTEGSGDSAQLFVKPKGRIYAIDFDKEKKGLKVKPSAICTYIFNNDTLYQTLIFSPVRQLQIWRFVTYTFLHAGAVHLMLNVIIQIMVAFPLETEQGHGRVLVVYGAGVVAGGLGASVFEPTAMVGASAGVYCLLMSHIPHIVMNFQSLSHRYFRLVAVLLLCVSDVIYSIRHCLTKGNLQPRIGVAAHVSGAICGLLIGFIVYRGGEKTMAFRIARYAALLLYVAWIVATVVYNVEKKF